MRFDAPYWWLLAPLLIGYLAWFSRRSYAQLAPWATRSALAARLMIMALLLAAVARPVLSIRSGRTHLVFLLDVSQSISGENLEAALLTIDRLVREVAAKTQFSVAVFGQEAKLIVSSRDNWAGWTPELRENILFQTSLPALYGERTKLIAGTAVETRASLENVQERIARLERFRDDVAGDHTDVERALRLALNCGSTADRRTVYLLTDANFNRGRWQRAWTSAVEAGTSLHTVQLDKPLPPDAAATDIVLPPTVRVSQAFTAEVAVVSNRETTGQLNVFKDGFQVEQRSVQLVPGRNVFNVAGLYFREKGFRTVEATIRTATDTKPANNSVRALVVVPGAARVLYVDNDEDQISYLKSALELEGMEVEARPGSGVPTELSELLSFDALILSNLPAERLSLRQMQMIRTYVQEFGGGFMMLGGDESFGLGGYFNTPIEEVLPVKMPFEKELTRPSLALILVIDKSGSMDGAKMQIAKRAAIATAEVINPQDQIGVIGFDGASRVVLELTPAADRGTVVSQIGGLDAGGGTFLYPALEDAQARLQSSNARRKHVIVLSDGQTQGAGYEDFVGGMAADGITLSAVGIGEGADMNLMEGIALAGGGRAYFTNDFYSIPQIFTREALRASNNMLVERLFQPVAMEEDASLREIDVDELPLLTGYVATTPKALARTLLVTDSGDPLLAKWRCGLGRTAAFTSETKPRWAEDWIEWPDFAKFWSQLIRSITGEDLTKAVSIECTHTEEENGVTLTADVRDADDNFLNDAVLELVSVDSQGRTQELPVRQRGPGLFRAVLPNIAFGSHQQFAWHVLRDGKIEQTASYGFITSYSPEFRTMGVHEETLKDIEAAEAGDVMSVEAATLRLGNQPKVEQVQLWQYFLLAAVILIPADILIRRMG